MDYVGRAGLMTSGAKETFRHVERRSHNPCESWFAERDIPMTMLALSLSRTTRTQDHTRLDTRLDTLLDRLTL